MDNRGPRRAEAPRRNVGGPARQMNKAVPPIKKGQAESPKPDLSPKTILYLAMGAVILLFVIMAAVNIILGVRSVEVIGTDMSSPDEIMSVAGIKEGNGYFSYNRSRSEEKVLQSIPCIKEIDISKSIFGKVKITVSEKKALWYTEFFGNYLALSDTLEVIRSDESKKSFVERGLVRLDFPEVNSAVLGRPIEFSDDGRDCSFIWDLLSEIQGSELYKEGRLDQLCIETKFEIFAVCDLKYKIKIGKYSNASFKLNKARDVLRDEIFSADGKWEIDVSGVPDIVSRPEDKLDFGYLIP